MKLKKTVFYVAIIFFVIFIYKEFKTEKLNYIAFGDSITESRNPYKYIQYGYTNYIVDYLKNRNKLNNYYNFSNTSYTIQNLIDDIENNKSVSLNGKRESINRNLRESDLVTINIGMVDISQILLKYFDNRDYDNLYLESNILLRRIVDMIVSVKKYAKNSIIAIGFFNPFQDSFYKENIDKIILHINEKYKAMCADNNIIYIEIFDIFDKNAQYLPNKNSINFNETAHKKIFERIRNKIDKV